jgi:rhodanese-related sulfurtransferase/DNA-binding transcriptional ArsR family regulator
MTSNSRQFKDAIYEQLARIGKSLASGPRLEILDMLCQSPRGVEALAKQVGQSVANTSHHLQVLRAARLVEARKNGVHVTYRLADQEVSAFYRLLRKLAESRLLEIEQVHSNFLKARSTMEAVDRESLVARLRNGAVTVLDVRPEEEFQAGHLPGAVSVPLADLERRLAEIPQQREVVDYCRWPYCVRALDAVELLRAPGFKATHMEEGVSDWQARGLPVETDRAEDFR